MLLKGLRERIEVHVLVVCIGVGVRVRSGWGGVGSSAGDLAAALQERWSWR